MTGIDSEIAALKKRLAELEASKLNKEKKTIAIKKKVVVKGKKKNLIDDPNYLIKLAMKEDKEAAKHGLINDKYAKTKRDYKAIYNNEMFGKETEKALGAFLSTYHIKASVNNKFNLDRFLNEGDSLAKVYLIKRLKSLKGLKYNLGLKVQFSRFVKDAEIIAEPVFNLKANIISNAAQTYRVLSSCTAEFQDRIENFMDQSSQWIFQRIIGLTVHIIKYKPIVGSSYFDLSADLNATKSLINVQNKDQECFKWAVLSALHPVDKDANRLSKYNAYKDELQFGDIPFPMTVDRVEEFETMNEISVHVFEYNGTAEEKITIAYKSKSVYRYEKHVNLLLVTNPEDGNTHYVSIKNFSGLFNYTNKHKGKKHYCFNCLHGFSSAELLKKHEDSKTCNDIETVLQVYPTADKAFVEFKNYKHKMKMPFVIYADFECITTKLTTESKNKDESYTNKYQEHKPCGYAYHVVSCWDNYKSDIQLYCGEDCMDHFMNALKKESSKLIKIITKNTPIKKGQEDSCVK